MKKLTELFEENLKSILFMAGVDGRKGWVRRAVKSYAKDMAQAVREYNKEVVGEEDQTRIASEEQMAIVRANNELRYEIRQKQKELL